MTPEEHQRQQALEGTVKRYRRRIVELKALAVEACEVAEESSRTCERGTPGCTVAHTRSTISGVALPMLPAAVVLGEMLTEVLLPWVSG